MSRENLVLGEGVVIGEDVEIGANVVIHEGTVIGDGVVIQDNVVLGNNSSISFTGNPNANGHGVGLTQGNGNQRYSITNNNGIFSLYIGGRLTVNANQAPGVYNGSITINDGGNAASRGGVPTAWGGIRCNSRSLTCCRLPRWRRFSPSGGVPPPHGWKRHGRCLQSRWARSCSSNASNSCSSGTPAGG